MNIFIIPSWYPDETNPIAGIFIKEQAKAIAALIPDSNIIIGILNKSYAYVPIRKPRTAMYNLFRFFLSKNEDSVDGKNFYEFYTPTLIWSQKFHFQSFLLHKSIAKSLARAKAKFGHIDIIHAHVSYPAGYIAYQLSQKFGIPYILTEHMSPFPFPSFMKENMPIEEIVVAFKNASKTIAVSNSLCTQIKSFNLPCSDVVPNFIDDELYFVSNRKQKKFTFFTLCGISEQKGINILLYAISQLDKELSEKIDFLIGGDGDMLQHYKKMATKLGLTNVVWLGELSRKEAPEYFMKSHAYVMPSRHETFGIVYAEAIACGLPVIATRCGGPEDIINSNNGILIDVDNIPQLVNAIKFIYNHYNSFNPVTIREDFKNRFSKEKFVDTIMTIYKYCARKP